MHAIAKSLHQIEDELNGFFLERTDLIRAMILAVLTGEHIFIIGPPGTSKSLIVRTFVNAITGARYFEVGMSKQRSAEAVMGPLDVLEFRNNGNYFLKRAGYASAVEFALIDEIGKMSAILGHDMLSLFNERIYHEVNGGRSAHDAPLSTAFCPSNEMITDESDDAAALWDRLLIRVPVDYLQSKKSFAALLVADKPEVTTVLDWAGLQTAIKVDVPAVTVGSEALAAMVKLRTDFQKQHLIISDRRWRAAMKVLKASAFLDGRDEVSKADIGSLRYVLWDTVEQIDKVAELCLSASNPFVKPLGEIKAGLNEIAEGVRDRESGESGAKWQYGKESTDKLAKVRDRLDMMLMEAAGQPIPGFKLVSDLHEEVLVNMLMTCLDMPEEGAVAVAGKKLGSGDGGNL